MEQLENRTLLATITVTGIGDTIAVDALATLREAITSVNNQADSNADVTVNRVGLYASQVGGTPDVIAFNIPGSGVHTIKPTTDLPPISKPLTIDGYSQPANGGAAASQNTNGTSLGLNTVLLIELDGSRGSVNGVNTGLNITGGGSVVRGLVINRFVHEGIILNSDGNVIAGNFIGTSAAGDADLGNGLDGVEILDFSNNTIGGMLPADRNLISGNDSPGVHIVANSQDIAGNQVLGNLIGTDKAGTKAIGNSSGVRLEGVFGHHVSGNHIGGTTAAARNVISGNGTNISVGNSQVDGNFIQGNFIGTDVTGTAGFASFSGTGVNLSTGSFNNTIGGTTAGAGNVISGNPSVGLLIDGGTSGNHVEGNRIGTNAAGTAAVPNGSAGVQIVGAAGNFVGGATVGAGNFIAFNLRGVGIDSGSGNSILGNSIFSNAQLGIDLGGDGVTQNDESAFPFDIDTGPNHLQNFPDLTSALTTAGVTTISGTLKSTANSDFRIEFFSNTTADPTGFGEGQTFLGFKNVTTDATGIASFSFSPTIAVAPGLQISSTATDQTTFDTSEFSADVCSTDEFTVTNTNDSGAGSLRQAILNANAHANVDHDGDLVPDPDVITFCIPGGGVHTITPTSALGQLPSITDAVVIDGYTQPGASKNTNGPGLADNAVLQVEISGSIITNNGNGINVNSTASGTTLRGLVIDNGWSAGILVNAPNTAIEGCFIGTDPTGLVAHGVTQAVNFSFGVDTSLSRVGGTTPDTRNILSGNGTGVIIQGGSGQLVQGNFIGVDATGAGALPNGVGVDLRSNGAQVGGATAAARNIIAGGSGTGIAVSTATGSLIQGNFIGTDATGTVGLGLTAGIRLDNGASGTQIGGTTATTGTGLGNVINATVSGGGVGNGIVLGLGAGSNNVIQGNLIGTDVTGTKVIGVTLDAVQIFSTFNTVQDNVIAGAGLSGILLGNQNANGGVHDNLIQGNLIGTDITGTNLLGNGADGILVIESSDNTISGNTIAGNTGRGVNINGGAFGARHIAILGNSIFSNGRLGIDLLGAPPGLAEDAFGVTPNDAGDPDTGNNNLQNFPVLTSAVTIGTTTTITGTLNSTPNSSFRIEFFTNASADPSLHGEGQTFVGFTNVTTDANGDANFSFVPTSALTTALFVSSTATKLEDTDQNGQTPLVPTDTSEFSADVCVADQFTVVNTNDSGPGSLRQAIMNANANAGVLDTITFCILGSGVHTIAPTTDLPPISDPVFINGYSQPGSSANTLTIGDNAVLLIELNGENANGTAFFIGPTGGGSTVSGLVINRFLDGIVVGPGFLGASNNNTITGNFIGSDPTGTSIPTGRTPEPGVRFDGNSNTLGGTTPAARNVIVGGGGVNSGLVLLATGSGNVVAGNYLGTNAAGTAALGPAADAILFSISGGQTIGGTAPGAGNVIVASTVGIRLNGASQNGLRNVIQGNLIGTDATGTVGLGGGTGIAAGNGASNSTIGGAAPGAGNVISGGGIGISIDDTGWIIQGNRIGTDITGTLPIPNTSHGILITFGGSDQIGGVNPGKGNTIAFNGGSGIQVSNGTGWSILGNSIFSNGRLGIDLLGGTEDAFGVTANDTGDADTGPNNLQNFPVITNVASVGGTTTISGTLNSLPTRTFRIEFFASATADPSGFGEGQTFLGSTDVTTNASGDAAFSFTHATPTGTSFTATATLTNGEGGLIETSEFSAAFAPVAATADLALAKTGPATGVAGTQVTYTLSLTNSGSADAQSVSVSDTLPAGETFVSASTGTGSGTSYSSGNLGTLAAGASTTITLVAAVNSAAANGTVLTNSATASTTSTESNTANNSTTFNTAVTTSADVSITKAGPATANAGQNITYTLTVHNVGPSNAQSVSVSDTLPAGETFVSASSGTGAGTSYSSGNLGALAAGASTTITIVAAIGASVPNSTVLTNTAAANSPTADTNSSNNTTTFNTTVSNLQADLAVTKTGPATVVAGTQVTYTLSLTNNGPTNAQSVSLSDTLPAGETFVSASTGTGSGASYSSGNLGTLTVGGSTTITIVAAVSSSAVNGAVLTNTASTTSTTSDPNAANNTTTFNSTVTTSADVSVTKTGPEDVNVGQNLTYTIVVSNAGPSAAQTVNLSDVIPANTTFVSATETAGPAFTLTKPSVGGTGNFTATIGSFAAGSSATFRLVVHVDSTAPVGDQIENTANVVTTTSDTNTTNNTASTEADIEEAPIGLPECNIATLNAPGAACSVALQADADNPGQNVLLVTGTSHSDVIVIEPRPSDSSQIRVRINGHLIGMFQSSAVQRIVAYSLNGNDTIIVNPTLGQSATLFGGNGNDFLFGGAGNDQLAGGSGNDHLFGLSGDDTLCGDDGNDFLFGGAGNDTLFGETGNDRLFGEAGNDLLIAGTGNDFAFGGSGNDQLFGQAGNDLLFGEAGNDIVVGGDGNDKLFGGTGRDLLIGGAGADQLFGEAHDDILIAGSTIFDESQDALSGILAEWTSSNGYFTRINNLRTGGGATGGVTLDSTTVLDDGAVDTLWGNGGQDWFLIGARDKLKDRAAAEVVN